MATKLIPKLDDYARHNMNVLLIGGHGVGKTYEIQRVAKDQNLVMSYYSAPTLDVWVDIVGVPIPKIMETKGVDQAQAELLFARSRKILDAEFIFFDEINRAPDRTLNAIFELLQFKSINGEKLVNLKMCWAAINPPGEGYSVNELDPALLDRFHAYLEVKPNPSAQFLVEQGYPQQVAETLVDWWRTLRPEEKKAVSPRRLEYMAMSFVNTGRVRDCVLPWEKLSLAALESTLAKIVTGGIAAGSTSYFKKLDGLNSRSLLNKLRDRKRYPSAIAELKSLIKEDPMNGSQLLDRVYGITSPSAAEVFMLTFTNLVESKGISGEAVESALKIIEKKRPGSIAKMKDHVGKKLAYDAHTWPITNEAYQYAFKFLAKM